MYDSAIKLINKINSLGYDAYIVGGYCRDLLINIISDDIDICTNAHPDDLKKEFEVIKDNSKYGSLLLKQDNYFFEVTSFRIDLEYNNRYPKIKYTNDLKEDLKRRDFTINTICIDRQGKIIDLMDAKKDLENRLIKCVGNTEKKIIEDPIRILRAIRFCGKFSFNLDEELKKNIFKHGSLIKNISKNQIKKEVNKMNQKSLLLIKEYNLEQYMKEVI